LPKKGDYPTVISKENGQNRSEKTAKIQQREQSVLKKNTRNRLQTARKSVKKTYFTTFSRSFFERLI